MTQTQGDADGFITYCYSAIFQTSDDARPPRAASLGPREQRVLEPVGLTRRGLGSGAPQASDHPPQKASGRQGAKVRWF